MFSKNIRVERELTKASLPQFLSRLREWLRNDEDGTRVKQINNLSTKKLEMLLKRNVEILFTGFDQGSIATI